MDIGNLDGAGESVLLRPVLTRGALARLRESGAISADAWERALASCGFLPGRGEWLTYWRHIFLLGGALFLLAGILFFIAWNWTAMPPFARMALTGAVLAGSGAGALLAGPDTRAGKVLLLSCGIAVGPMLAVFGQTYQSGSELWELFRAWTLVLLLLAAGGRQAGLWFTAWLVGNIFAALWLGRSLDGPFAALGSFGALPENLLATGVFLGVWEWAARRFRKSPSHAWLQARWLPRLLFFDLACRITGYLILDMLGIFSWHDLPDMFLPHRFAVPAIGAATAFASSFWYRRNTPDLFMLSTLLASFAALFFALLVKAEFLFDGGVGAVFVWGLIITGVTAGLGRALLVLQRSMAGQAEASAAAPSFGGTPSECSWETLWERLRSSGCISPDTPLPDLGEPASPWYVKAMLAFGGWMAALLFVLFLVLLLFITFRVRTGEGVTLFLVALPVMAAGGAALTRSGMFMRHFGFALALAGSGCAAAGILIMLKGGWAGFFSVAAFLAASCVIMRSGAFRFLAAMSAACSLAAGFSALAYGNVFFLFFPDESRFFPIFWAVWAPAFWWGAASCAFSLFLLREKRWRGTAVGRVAEPVFFGVFAAMLASQVAAVAARHVLEYFFPFFSGAARSAAFGAAAGLVFLAWALVRARGGTGERFFVMFCACASLSLAWYLPGVVPAFFGLAVARFIGSTVMQGAVAAYLFIYMIYYYYFLGIPLVTKSLLLAATGILLLLFAFCLGRYAAGFAAKEGGEHA